MKTRQRRKVRGRRHTFGFPSSSSADLLVRHHAVGLQWGRVSTEQASSRPVMFTEDCPVDVVKAITGHQAVSAGRTGETLKVVNVALCSHHHLTGRDGLSTCTTGSTVSKQPDVVILAEDHASFAVAGAAVLSQLSVAAGALEAACVPVLFHGEEQEAVCDSTSASCARPACCPPAASAHYCYCGRLHPAVHHSDLTVVKLERTV